MEKYYSRKRDEKVVDLAKAKREQIDPILPKKKSLHEPTPLMVVNEISKIFTRTVRENDGTKSLPDSERAILFYLSKEEVMTQLDLSERTHLKPPTISVSLAKLERKGYVYREVGMDDARKTYVRLTEKGMEMDKRTMDEIHKLDESAARKLSQEDVAKLLKMLITVRDSMLEDGAIGEETEED